MRHEDCTAMPHHEAQTRLLHSMLETTYARLQTSEAPGAAMAAAEMKILLDTPALPLESYPELESIDQAIGEALQALVRLCVWADEDEIRSACKTLRRIILSDRRRVDPDLRRHRLNMAIAQRRLWLIVHRSGLLQAWGQRECLQAQRGGEAPEKLEESLQLLEEYILAQEGYGRSLRQELESLEVQRIQ